MIGVSKYDVITMTEEQAGRLLNAVETMNANIARMASDIHQQGQKIDKIWHVLYDENTGIVKQFFEIKDYITKQKAYIIAWSAIGTLLLTGILKAGSFLFSIFSHIPK